MPTEPRSSSLSSIPSMLTSRPPDVAFSPGTRLRVIGDGSHCGLAALHNDDAVDQPAVEDYRLPGLTAKVEAGQLRRDRALDGCVDRLMLTTRLQSVDDYFEWSQA